MVLCLDQESGYPFVKRDRRGILPKLSPEQRDLPSEIMSKTLGDLEKMQFAVHVPERAVRTKKGAQT